jgi:hypothetical protein
MRLTTAAACAATAAICGTAVLSGASVASAAVAAKPKTSTVEYTVGDERIFITYQYPAQKAVPLVLSPSSVRGLAQRDLIRDLRVDRKVAADSVSVLVLIPCPPHKHGHHCHHGWLMWPIARVHWKHLCVQTGFGGAARSVTHHFPS